MNILLAFIFLIILFGILRTMHIEHMPNQDLFVNHSDLLLKPDGFYHGNVPGHAVAWLGKKFDARHQDGINVFNDRNNKQGERYPFKTYIAQGLHDKNTSVLAIDYNIPENPVWLRPILDEIVEVAPNQYLGKLHIRLIPKYPFTLSYFELKK